MDSTSDYGKIVALFIIYIPFLLLSPFLYIYTEAFIQLKFALIRNLYL
jgi:hypothetical protein